MVSVKCEAFTALGSRTRRFSLSFMTEYKVFGLLQDNLKMSL